MSEFKIRAYGRMELAQLYSPQLTDIAAYPKRRSFTPLEVRVIVDALGEP